MLVALQAFESSAPKVKEVKRRRVPEIASLQPPKPLTSKDGNNTRVTSGKVCQNAMSSPK